MVSKSAKRAPAAGGSVEEKRFKGVRMRSWGRWVSEIRLPNTRARLWLGSFATAHQAARAFDVAVVCLRGRSAALNFPDSPPAHAPLGLPLHQIQELAAAAAAAAAADDSLLPTRVPSHPTSSASTCSSEPDSPSSTQSAPEAFSPATLSEPHVASTAQSEPASSAACSPPSCFSCDEAEVALQSDTEELQNFAWQCSSLSDEQLCLGMHWDEELLWSSWLSSCNTREQQLLAFPLLPAHDNIIEDCLWSL